MKAIKLLVLAVATLTFSSCNNDDEETENTSQSNGLETITTVIVKLTSTTDATDIITLKSIDLDGDGGNDPVITQEGTQDVGHRPSLHSTDVYTCEITLLNEAEDITESILELGQAHQFFFTQNVGTLTYLDTDTNSEPIGLKFKLVAGEPHKHHTFGLVLKLKPTKGVDLTTAEAGGTTRVEVDFGELLVDTAR